VNEAVEIVPAGPATSIGKVMVFQKWRTRRNPPEQGSTAEFLTSSYLAHIASAVGQFERGISCARVVACEMQPSDTANTPVRKA
jgi:hypothetical protein